jgi:hypothetical protein
LSTVLRVTQRVEDRGGDDGIRAPGDGVADAERVVDLRAGGAHLGRPSHIGRGSGAGPARRISLPYGVVLEVATVPFVRVGDSNLEIREPWL